MTQIKIKNSILKKAREVAIKLWDWKDYATDTSLVLDIIDDFIRKNAKKKQKRTNSTTISNHTKENPITN